MEKILEINITENPDLIRSSLDWSISKITSFDEKGISGLASLKFSETPNSPIKFRSQTYSIFGTIHKTLIINTKPSISSSCDNGYVQMSISDNGSITLTGYNYIFTTLSKVKKTGVYNIGLNINNNNLRSLRIIFLVSIMDSMIGPLRPSSNLKFAGFKGENINIPLQYHDSRDNCLDYSIYSSKQIIWKGPAKVLLHYTDKYQNKIFYGN